MCIRDSNIPYSSQREIKAVVRSYALTHNEELNFTYLSNSKSWNTHTYTLSDIHPLKVDVLKDRKIYCTQARPCICQPGSLTGRGMKGLKRFSQTREEGKDRCCQTGRRCLFITGSEIRATILGSYGQVMQPHSLMFIVDFCFVRPASRERNTLLKLH